MEESAEIDVQLNGGRNSKKQKTRARPAGVDHKAEAAQFSRPTEQFNSSTTSSGIVTSVFDDSVENHFKAVDTIMRLCGDPEITSSDETEIQRISSSITFLREWKHFSYPPRTIQFASQKESNGVKEKYVTGGITLPQFSSAAVPKEAQNGEMVSGSESSEDFVMYVGGNVWAVDWCPRANRSSLNNITSEFVAVAAHPPESSYHKIGVPLTGRGVIQIWCLLNVYSEEEMPLQVNKRRKLGSKKSGTAKAKESTEPKRPRGRPRKQPINEQASVESTRPKRPRGRPRKNHVNDPVEEIDPISQHVQPLMIEYHKDSSTLHSAERASAGTNEQVVSEDSRKKIVNSVNADAFLLASEVNKKRKLVSKKNETDKAKKSTKLDKAKKSAKLQRPRAGSRKQSISKPVQEIDSNSEHVQTLAIEYPEDSSSLQLVANRNEQVVNTDAGTELHDLINADASLLAVSTGKDSGRNSKQVEQDQYLTSSIPTVQGSVSCTHSSMTRSKNMPCNSCDADTSSCCVPKDVALPRMMLCLAHNGKVAWDVKWRPFSARDSESMQKMGYLAVLLGNGALEVWEVPFPRTVKAIYPVCKKEGIDPRFIKLAPVFRCSKLKSGDRQSIPLTMEWSLHDMIVAGCHDGVVALWKFSTGSSTADTRPLLCFRADTDPIRALAWSPVQSDSEGTNVIATAGDKGLKLWDLRDPFRPLWDLSPVQAVINSIDWLPDPRCIIGSCDNGSIWVLGLKKAAYDIPVTGKPFSGTQGEGLRSYQCNLFPIWSIQASRLTGMIAYCSEDGTVRRLQLTIKTVEKEHSRNRPLHFRTGSLMEEESSLTVVSHLTNTPIQFKKSMGGLGDDDPRPLAVPNKEKQVEEKTAMHQATDEDTLALCFGDDTEAGLEPDEPHMAKKSKPPKKSKTSNKIKLKADQQAQPCEENDVRNSQVEESNKGQKKHKILVFPPKTVAMHKVRWNSNKGSGKWLCYGGSAGLVRCQQVDMSI